MKDLETPRKILRTLLDKEMSDSDWKSSFPFSGVHPFWEKQRLKLRDYILNHDYSGFLNHSVARDTFFRVGQAPETKHELSVIKGTDLGRSILSMMCEPDVGEPLKDSIVPGMSTSMLGMAYNLVRLFEVQKAWPNEVVELGGGYGSFSWLFTQFWPVASYAIIDLPEMIALQYYFLEAAGRKVVVPKDPSEVVLGSSEITLIPHYFLPSLRIHTALFYSTFALTESSRSLQQEVEKLRYFGADTLFIAGQLNSQPCPEDMNPQSDSLHNLLIGEIVEQFSKVCIERWHIGRNFLLTATNN